MTPPKSAINENCETAEKLYDRFISKLKQYYQQQQQNVDLELIIDRHFKMNRFSQLQEIDKLKSWLDSFRPLSAIAVAELKKLYDVQFTYNFNAIV